MLLMSKAWAMHSQWESLVHLPQDRLARASIHSQRVSLVHLPQPIGTSAKKCGGCCGVGWICRAWFCGWVLIVRGGNGTASVLLDLLFLSRYNSFSAVLRSRCSLLKSTSSF